MIYSHGKFNKGQDSAQIFEVSVVFWSVHHSEIIFSPGQGTEMRLFRSDPEELTKIVRPALSPFIPTVLPTESKGIILIEFHIEQNLNNISSS